MQSTITSKFQTTVPREIRRLLKLSIHDVLEWQVEGGVVVVRPVEAAFLQHRGRIRVGRGKTTDDVRRARNLRAAAG